MKRRGWGRERKRCKHKCNREKERDRGIKKDRETVREIERKKRVIQCNSVSSSAPTCVRESTVWVSCWTSWASCSRTIISAWRRSSVYSHTNTLVHFQSAFLKCISFNFFRGLPVSHTDFIWSQSLGICLLKKNKWIEKDSKNFLHLHISSWRNTNSKWYVQSIIS